MFPSRIAALCLLLSANTLALNKQGESRRPDSRSPQNLTGYVFLGPFLYNPTYAARPNNSGLALLRLGSHLDLDLYDRWLTLSYDANLFVDRDTVGFSEWDHVLGILTYLPLPHGLGLGLGIHFEHDGPLDDRGRNYSQSYVDGMARLGYQGERLSLSLAIGGFLYNPSYSARPDNTGLALLRYVARGEIRAAPWLALRCEANTFSDRQEAGGRTLLPSELDAVAEFALILGAFELRLIAEADLPLTDPTAAEAAFAQPRVGFTQYYVSALVQWNFELRPH